MVKRWERVKVGNRIIKESICTSDNLDTLSYFQEVFFYRLIVNCDDYGRMDGRVKILKSKLFPLKVLEDEDNTEALYSLTDAKLILLYQVCDHQYIQIVNWNRHQIVRNKKSRYPAPSDNNCIQLNSIDNNCGSNPIQSKSESESESVSESNPIAEMISEGQWLTLIQKGFSREKIISTIQSISWDDIKWKNPLKPNPYGYLLKVLQNSHDNEQATPGQKTVNAQKYHQRTEGYSDKDPSPDEIMSYLNEELKAQEEANHGRM